MAFQGGVGGSLCNPFLSPLWQQDIASLLRVELQACKQELELERSRSQDLHRKMQLLQAGSKHGAPPSPQQVGTILGVMTKLGLHHAPD